MQTDNKVKPATEATKAANKKVLDSLPFHDRRDFDDAQRDLIARPDALTVKDAGGNRDSFSEFLGLLDTFPFWFNIVTP